MTTLRPYPAYKNPGVEWLDEIPSHWTSRRLQHVAKLNPETLPENTDPEESFDYVDIGALGTGIMVRKPERMKFGSAPSRARRIVREGDTVLSTVRTYLKAAYHFRELKQGTVASTGFLVIRPNGHAISGYLSRAVITEGFVDEVVSNSVGVSYPAIAETVLAKLELPLPPLDEQRAIADFLDAMDAKITRFIAARRRMIALLEEQKAAIINQAVTRGLNPDVPLKPSGIDWLGDIPAHWEVLPLGRLVSIAGGMTPSKSISDYWTGTVPWISPKDMKSSRITSAVDYISEQAVRETGLAIVPLQSILIVVRGMILARKVPVAVTDIPLTINQDMKALVPKSMIGSDFLARLLEAAQDALFPLIDEAGHGTRRLPTLALLGLQLPVPPEYEQARIVAHIDDAVSKISGTARRHLREIELIQEYRTRLISDVVTGKVDVRGVDLPAPKEIIEAGVDLESSGDILDEEVIGAGPTQ